LQWFNGAGLGYYPVNETPYDQDYFDRFARQAAEPIGRQLMRQRVDFVNGYLGRDMLVDVGIGCGAFIERRNRMLANSTFGFDINPAGVAWLKRRRLWLNPYHAPVAAVSLWDVLEHIHDFRPLLANVQRWLFLALPIFQDAEHALRSKHFKPREHCWFFTRAGLVGAMAYLGFDLVTESNMETFAGREDIGAYCFKRGEQC
jgi:Methyltransferase domain